MQAVRMALEWIMDKLPSWVLNDNEPMPPSVQVAIPMLVAAATFLILWMLAVYTGG